MVEGSHTIRVTLEGQQAKKASGYKFLDYILDQLIFLQYIQYYSRELTFSQLILSLKMECTQLLAQKAVS